MDSGQQPSHAAGSNFQLHLSPDGKSLSAREALVKQGVTYMKWLREILSKTNEERHNISLWNEQIEKALDETAQKKTVIGVYGSTGAGKTSLLNALLDEGQLLPTDCMRACTSTVTVISFNDSEFEYKAEIEYFTEDEWKQDLETALNVIFHANQNGLGDAADDPDLEVFYGKLEAVYHDLTRHELSVATVDELMRHPSMNVLSRKDEISDNDADSFSNKLQLQISANESFENEDSQNTPGPERRSNWPLIRKVNIYVKAQVLSTGLTLVDLPGVQDSNAARAKVATDYMAQCSCLLVVTPIHRAVNDKVARDLLDRSLKRQMMMDDTFNTVVFVCTKSDEISVTEAGKAPKIKDHIENLTQEGLDERRKIKELKKELTKLKPSKPVIRKNLQTAREMSKDLDKLSLSSFSQDSDGSVLLSKQDNVNKRKRRETVFDAHEDSDAEESNFQSPTKKHKLAEQSNQGAMNRIHAIESEIARRENRVADTISEKIAICVEDRNSNVKQVMKRGFVVQIKEIEQELNKNEDTAEQDFETAQRKYRKLHDDLKVFCVSSKAFQKQIGKLDQEPEVRGFYTSQDTGVPQLQQHCMELTERGRAKSADQFLRMESALLNSLSLWISNEINRFTLTEEQRSQLQRQLEECLSLLQSKLIETVSDICDQFKEIVKNEIYKNFESAVASAENKVTSTLEQWSYLRWNTFRAICRRDGGVFVNNSGHHDWNEQLTSPILDLLASKWRVTFNTNLIETFHRFALRCNESVEHFHHSIAILLPAANVKIGERHEMLQSRLSDHKASFKKIEHDGTMCFSQRNRNINRRFKEVIQTAMHPGYMDCLQESGEGTKKRMERSIARQISNNGDMFSESTRSVMHQLDDLQEEVRQKMKDEVQKIHGTIAHEYMTTLTRIEPVRGVEEAIQRSAILRNLMEFVDKISDDFNRAAATPEPKVKTEEQKSMFLSSSEQIEDNSSPVEENESNSIPPRIFEDEDMADTDDSEYAVKFEDED